MKQIYIDAKRMRDNPTKAEALLLDAMTKIQLDVIAQAVLYGFISDFYLKDAKLTVEVDGPSHDSKEQKQRDNVKATILRKRNIETIRFSNQEVYEDAEEVALKIELAVRHRIRALKQPNYKHGIARRYRGF